MRRALLVLWAVVAPHVGGCGADSLQTRRAAPALPVAFEHKLTLMRRGLAPRELRADELVHVATNDEIWVSITPLEDAYVYIGYCDGAEFILYGEGDRPFVQRNQSVKKGPLTIEDGSKPEVFYVIASRAPVSRSSADLMLAMIRSRHVRKRIAVDGECEDGSNDRITLEHSAKRLPALAIAVVRYEFPRLSEQSSSWPASRLSPKASQPRCGRRARRSLRGVRRQASSEPAGLSSLWDRARLGDSVE